MDHRKKNFPEGISIYLTAPGAEGSGKIKSWFYENESTRRDVVIRDRGRSRTVLYGFINHVDHNTYIYGREGGRSFVNTVLPFCVEHIYRDYITNRDSIQWKEIQTQP